MLAGKDWHVETLLLVLAKLRDLVSYKLGHFAPSTLPYTG